MDIFISHSTCISNRSLITIFIGMNILRSSLDFSVLSSSRNIVNVFVVELLATMDHVLALKHQESQGLLKNQV
jgi:hypothetical protein